MSSEWLQNTYICINSLTFFPLRVGGASTALSPESELALLTHYTQQNSPEMMLCDFEAGSETATQLLPGPLGMLAPQRPPLRCFHSEPPCLRCPCHVEGPRGGAQVNTQLSQPSSGTSTGTGHGRRSLQLLQSLPGFEEQRRALC